MIDITITEVVENITVTVASEQLVEVNIAETQEVVEVSVFDGQKGDKGDPGASANLFHYKAKTSSITGNPGLKYLLWDNAVQINASNIHISHEDNDGNDIDVLLSLSKAGDKFIIQDKNESGNYQSWVLSADPTLVSGTSNYWIYPLTLVASSGEGTTGFQNNHELIVYITHAGPKGQDLTANEKRHDWVSPNSYCAQAAKDSSESANVWTIKRITVATNGTTTIGTATNVNWTDRLTHTYT